MSQLQIQTQQAVSAINNASAVVRATTEAVAKVVGIELPERAVAGTLPEAVQGFAQELAYTTQVFEEFTLQMASAPIKALSAPAVRPAAEQIEEPAIPDYETVQNEQIEESESLTAGAGGINHAVSIADRLLVVPTVNGAATDAHQEEEDHKPAARGRGKKKNP